ncbi:MAG: nuclear transport factor 2 family protein [Haliscomenobacteraceae bacterium CHB4]|nr:hypothetical protein [Saprospiraceae bacterium]MCE7926164.1 nuclear transport factor 2 family protein [Haliscomenobacteraceae bacterium CHB4]
MKMLILFTTLFSSFFASAQTTDETAVKNLIARETDAYNASDWTVWSGCWAHEKYISWSANVRTGYVQVIGWEALEEMMRSNFSNDPEPWKATVRRENWNVHINGNMAFVTFSQTVTDDGAGFSYTSSETRTCEKQEQEWKIIQAGALRIAPNHYALATLIRGLAYAATKDETPETFAKTVFSWSKDAVHIMPWTLPGFSEWIREWSAGYNLEFKITTSSGERLQTSRLNIGKSKELAGFFQFWGFEGANVERFYRELWRLELEAAGFIYEPKDDGDKTVETVRKK